MPLKHAAESRKKNLTIEVYELKDKVSFVFSNTFKRHKNMKDRNKKGVSSKGEGRGNGLYFASKLINENPWLEEKQEIIDNYYIQQIFVNDKEYKRKRQINLLILPQNLVLQQVQTKHPKLAAPVTNMATAANNIDNLFFILHSFTKNILNTI